MLVVPIVTPEHVQTMIQGFALYALCTVPGILWGLYAKVKEIVALLGQS